MGGARLANEGPERSCERQGVRGGCGGGSHGQWRGRWAELNRLGGSESAGQEKEKIWRQGTAHGVSSEESPSCLLTLTHYQPGTSFATGQAEVSSRSRGRDEIRLSVR